MSSVSNWALFAHIIGIVFWVGGLLAAGQMLAGIRREPSPEAHAALARLARKLLKAMAHPGAAVTVLAGITLLGANPGDLQRGWLHVKLGFVVILIAVDLFLTASVARLVRRGSEIPASRVKLTHAVVALLFLAIVFLAALKP